MANSPAYGLSNYALTVQNSTANSTVFSNSITGGTEFTIDGQGNITSTSNTIVGRSLVFSDGSVLSTASGASAVFDYTGDGVTTAFSTGNYSATSTLNTNVFISGVYQRKNQYTWSGTTITFTQPPPAGLSIEINIQTINTVITVPSAGTVTPSTLSTGGPSWDTFGNVTVSSNLSVLGTGNSYFAGNVGIGSSSPTVKLDVNGAVNVSSRLLVYSQNSANLTGHSTNAMVLGTVAKNVAPSGSQGAFIISSDDPWASAFQGSISLITDSTAANRRLVISSVEQGTAYRNITLNEAGGNVGIGTVSPTAKLVVSGGGAAVQGNGYPTTGAGWEFYTDTTTGSWAQSYSRTSSVWLDANWNALTHKFSTSGAERMRIDSSGSVGIGDSNPSSVLSVLGASGVNADARSLIWSTDSTAFAAGVGGGISFRAKYNTAGSYFDAANIKGIKENGIDGNFAGAMVFTTGPAGGSPTERMRIDSSGNVGIGTSSPSTKLDVSGSARIGTGSSTGGVLRITSSGQYADFLAATSSVTSCLFSDNTNAYGVSGTVTNHPFLFFTNNIERARIDTSGNMGLGTTSPATRLDVESSSAGTATGLIKLYNTNGSDRYTGIDFHGVTSETYNKIAQITAQVTNGGTGSGAAIGGDLIFRTNNSATNVPSERMRIDANGNMLVGATAQSYSSKFELTHTNLDGITTIFNLTSANNAMKFRNGNGQVGSIITSGTSTAFNTSSDYRLKNSVSPMTTGLATVSALKPVIYKWKSDNTDGEGFIAHELQAVIPHAVSGEKDAVNEDGSIKPQGVDYSKIVVHLVAAIQELKAEFDAYKESHP